ncbi:hypothetical protein CHELA1G11_11778 [Hyphomicrobiales bacterium]|nr:hypothetical protein CHELA1G11_11778 [Hyphomicrobiales bacterium]
MDDRGNRVEEGELPFAGERPYGVRQGRRGERAGGDDGFAPGLGWQARDLGPDNFDIRMAGERACDGCGESLTIDSQRATGGHLMAVSHCHDERRQPPHLLMEEADSICLGVVGAEGIGADQLGQTFALVGGRRRGRPHLVENDRLAGLRDLPGGFGAGEATADDVNWLKRHATLCVGWPGNRQDLFSRSSVI